MSNKKVVLGTTLTSIANAIRSKLGVTTKYKPSEMASAIMNIEAGTDVSDTTAVASDVMSGKIFHTSDGTKTMGTFEFENLTPDNANPERLYSSTFYRTLSGGFAIKSYSSVTPSNSNPATLTNGSFYRPGANGYAISSYTSLTPSDSKIQTISSGVYKMGSSGYVIDDYMSTDCTPSNATPPEFLKGWVYMNNGGFAIQSYESITPLNSSPVALSTNSIYKSGGSGYAISSYSSLTPSNTSPVSIASGSIYKGASSGYAIKSYSIASGSSSGSQLSDGAFYKISGSPYLYSTKPSSGICEAVLRYAKYNSNSDGSVYHEINADMSNAIVISTVRTTSSSTSNRTGFYPMVTSGKGTLSSVVQTKDCNYNGFYFYSKLYNLTNYQKGKNIAHYMPSTSSLYPCLYVLQVPSGTYSLVDIFIPKNATTDTISLSDSVSDGYLIYHRAANTSPYSEGFSLSTSSGTLTELHRYDCGGSNSGSYYTSNLSVLYKVQNLTSGSTLTVQCGTYSSTWQSVLLIKKTS